MPNGDIRIYDHKCSFTFRRLRAGMLVTITGDDSGQFGPCTLDELRMELLRNRPLELFVDARRVVGAAASVSNEWTRFFSLNREQMKRVSILVETEGVHLTVAIAQHLSKTGNLIQIYTDPDIFDKRLQEA